MTRINLVEPHQLTDRHLMAEYRELPRIFTAVKKLIDQGKAPSDVDIPNLYVLGEGHCKFFYNKLFWLWHRYTDLYNELTNRGFNLDVGMYDSINEGIYSLRDQESSVEWFNSYWPAPEEIYLNMQRITDRHFKD